MTDRQIKLDQCTGGFIIRARAASITLSHSYARVARYQKLARAACLSVVLCPEAKEILTAAMRVELLLQTAAEGYWTEQRASWMVGARCSLPGFTLPSPYPEFPFTLIDPELGILDLTADRFMSGRAESVVLSMRSGFLTSSARLDQKGNHDWTIRWTE